MGNYAENAEQMWIQEQRLNIPEEQRWHNRDTKPVTDDENFEVIHSGYNKIKRDGRDVEASQ
jgi:hypothetical protein